MKQQFERYTQEDFDAWKTLFDRQVDNLKDKACTEYLNALEEMRDVLYSDRIAEFAQLNDWFESRTGWKMYCVPGLIPVDEILGMYFETDKIQTKYFVIDSMEQLYQAILELKELKLSLFRLVLNRFKVLSRFF